jgi:hypothetical protein
LQLTRKLLNMQKNNELLLEINEQLSSFAVKLSSRNTEQL